MCASKNKAVCHQIQTHSGSSLPASSKEKVLGAIPRFMRPKMKLFAVKFWRILEVLCLQVLQKKLWVQFHDLCAQNRSCLLWNWDAFWRFSACKICRKGCGCNSTIYVSKNEAVWCGIQMHSGSSLLASFTGKALGAIPRFVRPKTKLFAVKFRRILEVLCLWVLQQKFWAQFHDLCVQKRNCFPWNSDAFWRFSACKFYRKSSGRNSTIFSSKNDVVCMKFRCIFKVLCLRVSKKKLWVQFHDFCVKKWSCLLWSSDAFWKLSPCKLCKKMYGCNFTIYLSKNEVVCCEIQVHFGVLALWGLWKIFRAHCHDLCVQKLNCLPWCSDAFRKFSASEVYRECSGQIFTIDVSKNEAVCCEVQMQFASFRLQDW